MGLPPDDDGELPQKEEAARAPQVRCARGQCITGAAVILTASPVAEGAADSTIDSRFGRALYTVALCERAAQDGILPGALKIQYTQLIFANYGLSRS